MKRFLNPAQMKCLGVFSVFAVIGFGPISPGCLIGMFVVINRPLWFKTLVENMYADLALPQTVFATAPTEQTKQIRIKCFLSLLGLFILDIAPVPVTPVVAFGIILSRPLWFYRVATGIYGKE